MSYTHLVTIQKENGDLYQKTFETKGPIPTVAEWNAYTDSLDLMHSTSWVVINSVTLKQ